MSALGLCVTFVVACRDALAASTACRVTDRWFSPPFSVFTALVFFNGLLRYLVLGSLSLLGLPAGLVLLMGLLPLLPRLFRTFGTSTGTNWGRFLLILSWRFGLLLTGNGVDEFWHVWSAGAEAGLLRAYHRAGSRHFLVGVRCISGDADLAARLLAVALLVSCIGSVMGMMLMWHRLSILSTLPLLLFFFSEAG